MRKVIQSTLSSIGQVILGKEKQVKLTLACLFAGGHLLIEDLPGMGKTTLSHVLARVLGLEHQRIQFTSDLLPADILGASIFDKNSGQFTFHTGPIFSQVVLADEINRATPKAQGALLEAMEERQVTIDGETRQLPEPFFVIATQNPATQMGTFPLPESQLDRFLMRVSIGYPDPQVERELILGQDRRQLIDKLDPVMDKAQLNQVQQEVAKVHLSTPLLDYLERLVQYTRTQDNFSYGLSPRGTLALVRSAKAWAYLEDREHVIPEDLQEVLPSVVEHRLRGGIDHTGHEGKSLAEMMLKQVEVVK